jgi:hypothetical protein
MRAALEPGEHEKQNVQTFFDHLVEVVPVDKRGHVGDVPDRLGYVEAAHKWGVIYMDALEQVRRKDLYGDSTAEPPLAILPPRSTIARPQQQSAYVRGYTLWYLCGRPKSAETPGDAEGARNHLWQYTVTADNPEGSRRFEKKPSGLADLKCRAREAFDFHTRSLDAQRMAAAVAGARSSISDSGAAPSGRPAGDRPAGKRPASSTPEEARVAATPKPSPPALTRYDVVVQHGNFRIAMNASGSKTTNGFLQQPEARHAFPTRPFGEIATAVNELLKLDAILRLVKSADDPTKGVPGALEIFPTGAPRVPLLGEDLSTRLRRDFKIDAVYDGEGGVIPADQWPPEFKALGLQLVDSGTYNTVWRFGAESNPPPDGAGLKDALGDDLAKKLIKQTHVLRMPKPRSQRTHEDVAAEIANVFEAHLGAYGPAVAAVWRGRFEAQVPGDGSADARYKLYMIVQRGTMSAIARIDRLKRAEQQGKDVKDQWKKYLFSLRACIWCFSANRCVHLDIKPGNFIDTYEDTVTKDMGVKVIDLDGRYYDRIERLRPEEVDVERGIDERSAMGWKPCWLFNILNMSCQLLLLLKQDVYTEFWWKPIQAAVDATMHMTIGQSVYVHDKEYLRARRFVMGDKALWTGYFFMRQPPPAPRPGAKSPDDLAEASVNMAKFYFHDSWWHEAKKRLLPAVRSMIDSFFALEHAKVQGRDHAAMTTIENTYNSEKLACARAWEWYDTQYRPTGLPMLRFFETELRDDPTALRLVQVMYLYAQKTRMDLHPYTDGPEHPDRRKNKNLTTQGMLAQQDRRIHELWPNKMPNAFTTQWVTAKGKVWGLESSAMEALGFGPKAAPPVV